MNIWFLIVLLALATALPRIVPALIISRIHFSRPARKFLLLLPSAIMAALIFPGIFVSSPALYCTVATIILSIFCGLLRWPAISAVIISALANWLILVLL